MKLIRKGEPLEESPGLLLPDGREVDASSFGEDYDEVFFETDGLERLGAWAKENADDLPLFAEGERYGSPIARPSKIVCIGLNYVDHAAESGMEIPEEPVIFFKASSAFAGPTTTWSCPGTATRRTGKSSLPSSSASGPPTWMRNKPSITWPGTPFTTTTASGPSSWSAADNG